MGRVEQLGIEFNAHGGRDVVVERGGGVGETSDEGGFADAGIAEHDDFVEGWFGGGGGGSIGHDDELISMARIKVSSSYEGRPRV
jgi:hypothetical protein